MSLNIAANINNSKATTKYVIVTPARDEEAYLRLTIESMLRQTVRPQEWVIINDGSKDNTGAIIEEYAGQHSWIHGVTRMNRGFRKSGGGVIETFYEGFRSLETTDWDFIVKLDGDLSFAPDYFERCFAYFHRIPELGVGGPFLYHMMEGEKVLERCPDFHVRGAAKIYRRSCWEAIGGLWVGLGWDTLDEVKANMLGWTSQSFPDVEILHHRYTGAAYGRLGGMINNGRGDYACGYHPLFVLGKTVKRLPQPPYLIGSMALLYGYLSGYWKRLPRVNDDTLIRYVRSQQIARMRGRSTIWK